MFMSGWNGQFNGRLQRLEKKGETELPKPSSADAGKVITVNEDGDGYVLAEGGSGQSVLVANVEMVSENAIRLDKTWLECKNADCLLIRDSVTQNQQITFPHVIEISRVPSLSDPTQISYRIEVAFAEKTGTDVVWHARRLSTDTETGYPEYTVN